MQRVRSNKEFLKYADRALCKICLALVFHGCIHYYCNNSGMDFHYNACILKGIGRLSMQNHGEFKCHCLRKCSRGQKLWSTDLAET